MKAGKGRVVAKIEVPPVVMARMKSGLSQSEFASLLGVSVRTLQDWEQGRKQPSGAARTLITRADDLRAGEEGVAGHKVKLSTGTGIHS